VTSILWLASEEQLAAALGEFQASQDANIRLRDWFFRRYPC